MKEELLNLAKQRRSIYALGKQVDQEGNDEGRTVRLQLPNYPRRDCLW